MVAALVAGLVLAGCGNDAPDGDGTSDRSTGTPSGGATSGAGGSPTGSPTGSPAGSPAGVPAEELSFPDLMSRAQQLVGQRIEVVGKAFFVPRCPPPGTASQCVLVGYLADANREQLIAAEVNQAIPIVENGQLLSCPEGSAPDGGCSDWRNRQRYRVIATVEHRVLGGRETQEIELRIISKQAV